MLPKLASCKILVFMCLRLILKVILRILGLKREDVDGMPCNETTPVNEDRSSAAHNYYREGSLPNNQKGKCPKHDDVSSCDAGSESSGNCIQISREFRSSRKKRFLRRRSLQAVPSSSTQARRYSISSGISTGSDTIFSEFEKMNYYSADCDASMKKVSEIENTSLRAILEGLVKEKLELQETIRHQESILENGNYFDCMVLERNLKEKIFSTLDLSQNADTENNEFYCGQFPRQQASGFRRSSMPIASSEGKELNGTLSCYSKQDGEDAPEVFKRATERNNSVTVSDGTEREKRLGKLKNLESENVRLQQYINRLLCMVLEGSPSVLETSRDTSNN